MATTSVRVALRVRPITPKEILANSVDCIAYPGNSTVIVGADSTTIYGHQAEKRPYTFDHVFPPSIGQDEVFKACVLDLIDRFLEGFNATILAYGQTGSGKTYRTMLWLTVAGHSSGIVPRAIYEIYNRLEQTQARLADKFGFQVFVSFLELYNEDLLDLLNPRPRTAGSSGWGGLSIREDGNGNIVWTGVREEEVKSPEELLSFLQKGSLYRTTGTTDMNTSSSRSHAIFSVILKQRRLGGHLSSKFHFVDLAGSERLKRTNAAGERKKEGISINQGLLALGNVISALGDESRRAVHIPYRDSKLTRMLQDSLGGNSQTLMLACVSPSDSNYGETVNTLNYANRTRNIKNRVAINQD
ncbi:P-loop containing nucleoside triphosphate hydrolase protein, partial [Polychytrium aggregatum]|uniref:P-loop containing nucleoside triphosphate hydrolase protein n=1 Tax=Polychytrium aggregatum TaxID=110093 RepID=UPI0022FE8085